MPKRTTNSPGTRAVTVIMVMAALGVGVFAAYVQMNPAAKRVPDELRRPKPAPSVQTLPKPVERDPAPVAKHGPNVLVATVSGSMVKLVNGGEVPSGEEPMRYAVNQSFKNIGLNEARVVAVEVKEGLAMVDVNQALTTGMGSTEESNVIRAICLALGQFPQIDKFQLRFEGQVLESLGHFEMIDPTDVIRPGSKEATNPTSEDAPSEAGDSSTTPS